MHQVALRMSCAVFSVTITGHCNQHALRVNASMCAGMQSCNCTLTYLKEPSTAVAQHRHMSGTGETCLHPKPDLCCRLLPGKSSVRTRSSVKLSRLNARKRKHSRRRPTFLTSPGCESKGRNRCASSHSICVVLPHVQSQAVCNQELIVKFIKVCEDVAAQKKSVQAVATLCAFLIRQLCVMCRC